MRLVRYDRSGDKLRASPAFPIIAAASHPEVTLLATVAMDNIGPTARGRAKVDRLNTHTADYDYTSAPRRVRFTRRSLRQMRRYVVYTLTALVVLFLWNTFDPPAEESRLARYTLRRLKRGKEGEKRKGSIGRDGRLHLNWPGWDGIRNIYAL